MPYVNRVNGKIQSGYARLQHKGQEWVEDDSKEYLLFLNPPKTEEQINEEKIQFKIRDMAIEELKKTGELPEDYTN